MLSKERCGYVFDVLDSNGSGYLNEDVVYRYLGCNATDDMVKQIMFDLDVNQDGVIDRDDFIK